MIAFMFSGHSESIGYSDERFRHRIRLAISDRDLHKAYWDSHVSRRRGSLERVLQAGIDRGLLRSDIDPATASDLIVGVAYYQLVVRGEQFTDAIPMQRCRDAFDIAWRGMLANEASPPSA